jgi:hypothetical protein
VLPGQHASSRTESSSRTDARRAAVSGRHSVHEEHPWVLAPNANQSTREYRVPHEGHSPVATRLHCGVAVDEGEGRQDEQASS